MNQSIVDQIVRAVLYEGYVLYPYRPSVKTQQRWTFGGIYPKAYSHAQLGTDPYQMQTQCLLRAGEEAAIALTVRFLHLTARTAEVVQEPVEGAELKFRSVPSIEVGGRIFQTWQEAVERKIETGTIHLSDLLREHPHREVFSFPHVHSIELLPDADGRIAGRLVREQQEIDGTIEFSAERKGVGLYELTARVENHTVLDAAETASRELAQLKSFASTHIVLVARDGQFISPTDPPESLRHLADECSNIGCWPVLVGEPGATDTLLVSPIILSDYPQVAPESPGDLFDGCEIDEILTLRILTLTDEEKRQAIAVDPMAADMMARTEALAREQLMNLHGTVRDLKMASESSPPPQVAPFAEELPMSEAYYG
jgi:hypothetical protein